MEEEICLDNGSHLVKLRYSFSIPLQIYQRGFPMMEIPL